MVTVVLLIGGEYAIAVDGDIIRGVYWSGQEKPECEAAAARLAP